MLAQLLQASYYTAYWNNAKHPVSLDRVLSKLCTNNTASKKPEVNVDKFQELERRMQKYACRKSNNSEKR